MLRVACATSAVLVLAATGCKRESSPEAAATTADSAASQTGANDSQVASLPGELWFLERHSDHGHHGHGHEDQTLVRLRGGERFVIASPSNDARAAGQLYPSRTRLPDGRVIAISSKGDGSPDSEQLVLVDVDGKLAPIGPAAAKVRDPVVAAGGRWIVASHEVEGVSNLYALEVATGELSQLTDDPEGNFRPASLGGDELVFVSSRDGDAELYRAAVGGGEAERLTAFHKDDFEPVPSPDGKTLVFQSDREGIAPRLFLMNVDGTETRRLTQLPSDANEEEVEATWSPDGKLLAYIRRDAGKATLVVRELATGTERELTPAGLADAEPTFSPDGAWLAVTRNKIESYRKTEVWVIPVGKGEPVRVAAGRLPRWF